MINTKEYFRKYYLKNKEKLNAKSREYFKKNYLKLNTKSRKEHLREYFRQYYLKNKEKLNANSREYFKKNNSIIKKRNCKQCNKLFSPKRKNGVCCSSDCTYLIKRYVKKYYFKDYRKLKSDNNKKITMPKFNYSDNYNWDEIDKL